MNAGALRALEFDRIVTAVAELAVTPTGHARLAELCPSTDAAAVIAAQQATSEGVRFLADHPGFPLRAPADLDESTFGNFLYTAGQPDPDLMIRTSGELRVSNFLLWQIAYAEIWVTETLWPDFRCRHLLDAIIDFQKRERRYGAVSPQPATV